MWSASNDTFMQWLSIAFGKMTAVDIKPYHASIRLLIMKYEMALFQNALLCMVKNDEAEFGLQTAGLGLSI